MTIFTPYLSKCFADKPVEPEKDELSLKKNPKNKLFKQGIIVWHRPWEKSVMKISRPGGSQGYVQIYRV